MITSLLVCLAYLEQAYELLVSLVGAAGQPPCIVQIVLLLGAQVGSVTAFLIKF